MRVPNFGVSILITVLFSVSFVFSQELKDVDPDYRFWSSTDRVNLQVVVNGEAGSMTTMSKGEFTGESAGPSTVRISGRVLSVYGVPIRNAQLVLYVGNPPFAAFGAISGSLGTYVFQGLPVGQTYTVIVSAKRYRFEQWTQTIVPTGDFDGLDFFAFPQY